MIVHNFRKLKKFSEVSHKTVLHTKQHYTRTSQTKHITIPVCRRSITMTKVHYRNFTWAGLIQFAFKRFVFWDIGPCSPLKVNRTFGATCRLHLQGRSIRQGRNQHEAGSKLSTCSLLVYSLACSSKTSVGFQRTTLRYIQEGRTLWEPEILHSLYWFPKTIFQYYPPIFVYTSMYVSHAVPSLKFSRTKIFFRTEVFCIVCYILWFILRCCQQLGLFSAEW
jgi:hypothetical protein